MKTTDNYNATTCLFVDDILKGMVLECGHCGSHFPHSSFKRDEREFCPHCKLELLLPAWASW